MKNWYKIYRGTCEDAKFTLIANSAGVMRGLVLAFWFFVLEKASENDSSDGVISSLDFDSCDCMLGAEEGTCEKIFNAMVKRKLVTINGDGEAFVTKWRERQGIDKQEAKKEYLREYAKEKYRQKKEDDCLETNSNHSNYSNQLENNSNFSNHSNFSNPKKSKEERRGEESRGEERRREEKRVEEKREEENRGEERREEGEESLPPVSNTPNGVSVAVTGNPPLCPHKEIISLYNSILTELPHVKAWNETRQKLLQTRWREDKNRQNLKWWEEYFALVKRSDFLTGKVQNYNGRQPFVADLEWLIKPNNMAKVLEGKYDNRRCSIDISQDDSYEATLERVSKEFPHLMGGVRDGA